MKKVFVMPSLTINGKQIDKVEYIDGLGFPSPNGCLNIGDISSEGFSFNRGSLAIEIEAAVELPSPRDDIWETLIDDRRMDIVIKDERGRELHIPNAQIIQRVRITGRIPRRMKKHLKRIHGVHWKQYHPNAENEVNINSK